MDEVVAPGVALVLYLLLGALGLVWRNWRHRRQTGASGVLGLSGHAGSPEWLAGVGFVVAIVMGFAAPIAQLAGLVSPIGALDTAWVQVVGAVVAVAGLAGMLRAQADMGRSWRVGVDPGESTELVRRGVFARVRNPIFTTMIAFTVGVCLITPDLVALAGLVVLVVAIQMQVRVVEEPYLRTVHGADYDDYAHTVGRFVPGLGRL